ALSSTRLVPIRIRGGALDVTRMADRDQHLGIGDQVFQLDFVDLVHDLRSPIVAVGFLHFLQLAGDDLLQLFVAGKNFFQLRNVVADGFQFLQNFIDGELREAMELQFKNGIDLDRSQPRRGAASSLFAFQSAELIFAAVQLDALEFLGLAVFRYGDVLLGEILEQVLFCFRAAGRPADDADDIVKMVERDLVADQDVLAFAGLAQLVNGAAANDFDTMLDEQLDERDEAKFARLTRYDGQQDHAERFLHLRVLEKIVEDQLRFLAALDFHNDTHSFARRFVAHIGNAFDFFGLH